MKLATYLKLVPLVHSAKLTFTKLELFLRLGRLPYSYAIEHVLASTRVVQS